LLAAFCVFVGLVLCPSLLPADAVDGFRIENRVFRAGDREAASRSTTIFHEGLVYDYLSEPSEVIVFDQQAGRFTLIDVGRHVRCELATSEVQSFVEQLVEAAAEQDDPFVRFLSAPELSERFDSATGVLTLSSSWLSYEAKTVADVDQVTVDRYRQFADWYARLNAMLNPGSPPPTARLALNAALARRGLLPREVSLTMTPKRGFPPRRVKLRSDHQVVRPLAAMDLDRIAQTREFMRIFKLVGFQDYR